MFGIKSLAGLFRRNICLAMALLSFFIGWITVKISKFKIFSLNINEIPMTLTFSITVYVLMWITSRWINSSRKVIYVKSKEFFQLVKLSMDISTEVLRKFMDARILSNAKYGGCLHKFLDVEKHNLYHQWQGSTPCCKCPAVGCTLRKSKTIKEWLFKIFYSGNPYEGIHVKFNGQRISEYCLDCFVPSQGLKVNSFDVTILSFFIKHFVPLSQKEMSSLNDIVSVRNSICHAMNTSSFHSKELENMWTKLSEALLIFTDSPSRNLLKDQIIMIKKVEFDSTDIEILEEKVERAGKMLEEIFKFVNQNCVTKDCMKETERRIVAHFNAKTECLHDDVKALKEGQEKTDDKLGILIERLDACIMEFHLSAQKTGKENSDSGELTDRLIDAVGQIDNENINEKLVVQNIEKISNTASDQDKFNVVSAKQSCIILNLVCSPKVLTNEYLFRDAVKLLFLDIIRAGNVDTSSPSTILFQLKFCSSLTQEEMEFIKDIVKKTAEESVSPTEIESKDALPQAEKESKQKFEVYKIAPLESQALFKPTGSGIIILTGDSRFSVESEIEVRFSDKMNKNLYRVPPEKVIQNVIEFKMPVPTNFSLRDPLYVSLYDKKKKIETSKVMVKLQPRSRTKQIETEEFCRLSSPKSGKFSKYLDIPSSSPRKGMAEMKNWISVESGFGSDREVEDQDDYNMDNQLHIDNICTEKTHKHRPVSKQDSFDIWDTAVEDLKIDENTGHSHRVSPPEIFVQSETIESDESEIE
ncbi:unnamed protein product [Mytilus coruscus]|uniref:DZIP3-like HEPN domain-containing protein n=1 Tax=Mytilus coruscus TaxID=42192 RepID=A0A6J8A006_MYTCO|nr:unnamed protein product [Mytilus coruscus]